MASLSSSQRGNLLAAVLLGLLAWGVSLTPLKERVSGYSVDAMLYLRHWVFGQRFPAETSPTVVVALDEETYRTPPFNDLPHVLWTPQFAKVQDAILAGGAKVVGYDLILPTSLEAHLPGYEKPFLRALLMAARQGKLVLGKVQHSDKPVAPHPAQSMVVRHQQNIRALNMHSDHDDVIRRIPLMFETQKGGDEPSMSLELAARALGVRPERGADGALRLAERPVPGSESNAALINFQGGADIPTYSLADLYACAEQDKAAFFRKHFADKVVLLGMVLDVEDRKLTSKRLMTEQGAGAEMERCVLPVEQQAKRYRRDTIPGVYILASAVNDFLRQDFLRPLSPQGDQWLLIGSVLLVVLINLWLAPAWGVAAVVASAVAWVGGALYGLQFHNLLLPVLPVLALMGLSYALMLLYRYTIADQEKKRIRNLFSLYLEPAVVDQMVASDQLPELGGEMREVTIWFSDLANFTNLSEGLSAQELVALMNRYFSVITDIIEDHGGFVDKYIGDAIVAVFGAPHDDPYHAGRAVAASLMAREALKKMNRDGVFGDRVISTRTGLNTGMAVVGNVGSSRRFNYTVMGDTVNLASRLEGANKATGSEILIADSVAEKLPETIILRELATIRVKGKRVPTKVYEPITLFRWYPTHRDKAQGKVGGKEAERFEVLDRPDDLEQMKHLAQEFSQAQEDYRQRRFQQVIDRLQSYADDPAAQKLMDRAQGYLQHPPAEDWDGVETLSEK